MKSIIKISVLLMTLCLFVVTFQKHVIAQPGKVSFQVFYDQLSPYGQWVDFPNYGYVWIPSVRSDFAPYSSDGFWKLTNLGWTWISDYDWGWAPFHYGRWNYENYYGWYWVPGNEWGPSWVDWRQVDGYYGWRPMMPHSNMGLVYDNNYNSYNDHWIFVKSKDITRFNVNRYFIDKGDQNRFFINSTPVKHKYNDQRRKANYFSGPSREDLQRSTGMKIRPVLIRESNIPVQNLRNGKLHVYRPQITIQGESLPKPIPNRISDLKEVKRPSERDSQIKSQNSNSSEKGTRESQNTRITKSNVDNKEKPVQIKKTNTLERNNVERKTNTTRSSDNKSNRQQSESKTEKTNRRNK